MCVYVQISTKARENVKSSGIGATGSCELPTLGTIFYKHMLAYVDTDQEEFICQGNSTLRGAQSSLLTTAKPDQNESVPVANLYQTH